MVWAVLALGLDCRSHSGCPGVAQWQVKNTYVYPLKRWMALKGPRCRKKRGERTSVFVVELNRLSCVERPEARVHGV